MRRSSSPAARVLTLFIVALVSITIVHAQDSTGGLPTSLPLPTSPGTSTEPAPPPTVDTSPAGPTTTSQSPTSEPASTTAPTTSTGPTSQPPAVTTSSRQTSSSTQTPSTSSAAPTTSSSSARTTEESSSSSAVTTASVTDVTSSATNTASSSSTSGTASITSFTTTDSVSMSVSKTTIVTKGQTSVSYYTSRVPLHTDVSTGVYGSTATGSASKASSNNGFFANKGAVAGTFTGVTLVALFLGWFLVRFIITQRRRARRRVRSTFIQRPKDDLENYEKEKGYGVEMGLSKPDVPELPAGGNGAGAGAGGPPTAEHAAVTDPVGAYPGASSYGATSYGGYASQGQAQGHSHGHQVQPSQDYSDAYADAYTDGTQYGGQHQYDQHQYQQQSYDTQHYGQHYTGQPVVDYPPAGTSYPTGTAYANAQRQEGQYQYTGATAYGSDAAIAQARQHAYSAPGVAYGTAQ